MTSITDILAMEPRYTHVKGTENNLHYSTKFGQGSKYELNILNDAELNAAKAILGKKLAEALAKCGEEISRTIKYDSMDMKALHELVLLSRAALAQWNKLEGVK